jgi:allantoinase
MTILKGFQSPCVITPEGLKSGVILVKGEKILKVVSPSEVPSGCDVEKTDLAILPGLVDVHVHINEPGRTEWEGFQTATQAASAGGITTVVDMPLNSSPVTTTVENFHLKLNSARGKMWADCGFYGGLVPGNIQHLEGLIQEGVLGIKAFMVHSGIDEFPQVGEQEMREALPILARHKIPFLAHAELDRVPAPANLMETPNSYKSYLASRPPIWEIEAIALLISLCRRTSCPVHIVHLSASQAVHILQEAKEKYPDLRTV